MELPEPKTLPNAKYYVLKVKRKHPEKPVDSLILETTLLPDRRKRMRVSPPEDYLQDKISSLGLNKGATLSTSLLFTRLETLGAEVKKAVKVGEDGDCSLFELPAKDWKKKERYAVGMNPSKLFDQKEKSTDEQARNAKEQRNKLIGKGRKISLIDLKEGKLKIRIEENKEADPKVDILYCNETLMTLELYSV